MTYEDKVWAAPQFFQPPAIMLNKRVMDEAGVTADRHRHLQARRAARGGQEDVQGRAAATRPTLGFDPVATGQAGLWILGFGGQLMDDDGVPTLDDPNNAKALAFLKQLYDAQGGYAKVKSFSDSFDTFGEKNQYVKDQVGAQVNAQWYVNVLTPVRQRVDISAVPFKDQTASRSRWPAARRSSSPPGRRTWTRPAPG